MAFSLPDQAKRLVTEFVNSVHSEHCVKPTNDMNEFQISLSNVDGEKIETVIECLCKLIRSSPRTSSLAYYNSLFNALEPVALLAEITASLLNNSLYTFKVAGPHVFIERELLQHMSSKLDFPDKQASGMFTPGGSLSNMTALIVARNEMIEKIEGIDARNDGIIRSSHSWRIYSNKEAHYSVKKSLAMIGLGRNCLSKIDVDDKGSLRPELLREAIKHDIAAGLSPMAVVAFSGTTVRGAFDPLDEIADICEEYKMWLHVDGAFGGSAILSRELKQKYFKGVHRVDSFTWDAHKAMGVPLTCSALLFREKNVAKKHFNEQADYLFQAEQQEDFMNPGKSSIQCGRRNDVLKLWATWKHLGDAGYERRIHQMLDASAYATQYVRNSSAFILVSEPQFLNVCFRAPDVDSKEICDLLEREGHVLVGWANVKDDTCIRAAFINPITTHDDVDRFFGHVEWAVATIRLQKESC